jgi:hypothetical protein
MKRLLLPLIGVLAVAALALAPAAVAASPHYIRGPTATVDEENNSLVVSFKAAGLGDSDTVDFALTGTVKVESQCFTKSGNPVQGVPKKENVDVNATGSFDVRHGQVTGEILVTPLSTLTCTGNHEVRILSVSDVNLILNGDELPPTPVTVTD